MENAFSFVGEMQPRMQGGDSRYNRQLFREANPDLELESKCKKVTDKMSESMNIIANEPSLAFFRIQEHVRKCLPQLVETKHEVLDLQQQVQGASFDAEYAANAVKGMHRSGKHFQNVQDLLKNAMFIKQQIDYEASRRDTEVEATTVELPAVANVGIQTSLQVNSLDKGNNSSGTVQQQ